MGRRGHGLLVALPVVAVLTLPAGCAYDAAKPVAVFTNEGATDVVVTTLLAGEPYETPVPAGESVFYPVTDCAVDSSLAVATVDGDALGTVDEPVCQDRELTITGEGGLVYADLP